MSKGGVSVSGYVIYPRPQWVSWGHGAFSLGYDTKIMLTGGDSETLRLAAQLRDELAVYLGATLQIVEANDAGESCNRIVMGYLDNEFIRRASEGLELHLEDDLLCGARGHEGYFLAISDKGVILGGGDASGIFYGIQSLLQLVEHSFLASGRTRTSSVLSIPVVTVYDWPYKEIRGVHLYMPGRKNLEFFRRLLRYLAALKYNTLFLEVGGGMEFTRHPEINIAWEKFVKEAESYPGGPRALQTSQSFPKDSTHTELGGGGWLSRSEVKGIVEFARGLHMEVIPEVQSLSHAYYLGCSHPEIAERQDDPWPDTYCPSNPASYQILFDVLDEVIEVFNPKVIHVGHDEAYTFGICPRCRGKSGAELLAGDINRIYDFLKSRGIRMAMWGDKLQNILTGGTAYGGVHKKVEDHASGKSYEIPETYQAVDLIPKDILILDWYWELDPRSEDYFAKKGFEIIWGNFCQNFKAQGFRNWEQRGAHPAVRGAEVSTWCDVSEFALAHNGCFFNFAHAANMLWWSGYSELERENTTRAIALRQPVVRDFLGSRQTPSLKSSYRSILQVELRPLLNGSLPVANDGEFGALERGLEVRGVPLRLEVDTHGKQIRCVVIGGDNPLSMSIDVRGTPADSLIFLHSSAAELKRRPTWNLENVKTPPYEEIFGYYLVEYVDGGVEPVEIRFGSTIANWDQLYGEDISSICYWADPVWMGRDPRGRRVMLYAYEWINPSPDRPIKRLHFQPVTQVASEELQGKLTSAQRAAKVNLVAVSLLRNVL